jgi:ankyrin repeat protein
MKKNTIYVLILLLSLGCAKIDKSKLLGYDYRLFDDTPVEKLAKAIENNDLSLIGSLINSNKLDVNYQETKFGQTLLMLTVMNHQYETCKYLLDLGANPNIHNTYTGSSCIIYASSLQEKDGNSINFIKLLLEHGANPNEEEVGDRNDGNSSRKTPLSEACKDIGESNLSIEKVKLLVEAGAKVNYHNDYGSEPLVSALISENYDVVLFGGFKY